MKKTIKLLLTLAIIALLGALMAFSAFAATYTGKCGTNVSYKLDTSTGLLEISGTGEMTNYSYSGAPWYSYRSYVKTVKISDGVTSIGSSAFFNCSSLKNLYISDLESWLNVKLSDNGSHPLCSAGGNLYIDGVLATDIEIPDTVSSIGNYAFSNCDSIKSVKIPDSVTSIGERAFYYCSSLASIEIPDSVTSIGSYAFRGCSSLASIEIPDSVTSICEGAFEYCRSLASIEIPDSVTSIGLAAFRECSSLASIEIPDSVTSIGSYAFGYCSSLASIEIPDSVTSIGYKAFYYCSSLTSIEIPDSVTSIGEWAFYYCSSLTNVTFKTKNATIASNAFYDCSKLETIYLYRDSTADNYFGSSYTKKYLDVYTITYDLNGGSGDFEAQTKNDSEPIYLNSNIPTKEGYNFGGWKGSDGKTYSADGACSANQDLTLTAIWQEKTYNVTYDANGGTGAPTSQTKYYFTDLVLASPTKEGYNFIGWNGSDGNTYAAGAVYTTNADITLTAIWEVKTYTVTYDANGSENAPEPQTKTHFETLTLTDKIPTREGYDFVHWKTEGEGTVQLSVSGLESAHSYSNNMSKTWSISHASAKSISLTFDSRTSFESNYDYLYIYDKNDNLIGKYSGTSLASKTITVDGDYIKLKMTSDSSNTYWGFAVTSAIANCDGFVTYAPGETFDTNEDTTLYAVWDFTYVTMTYDACGGVVSPSSKEVQYTQNIGNMAVPTRDGYTFDGWFTEKDGGEVVTSETVIENLADFTVYAHWSVNSYSVSFNANGGSVFTANKTVTFDSAYGELPISVRDGCIFEGWYTKKDGGELVTAESIVKIPSSHTLYAHWSGNTYLVSFNANGGTCDKAYMTVTYNAALGELPVPTRDGYTFLVWSRSYSSSSYVTKDTVYTTADDTTLYAIWSANTYKLTFDARGGNLDSTGKTVTFDSSYGFLPIPTKENYTFDGWYLDESFETLISSYSTVKIADDHKLYAMWRRTNSGDANGDGNVDIKDLVLFSQHLAGWNVSLDDFLSDCNCDGKINIKDIVLLAQYLANWDVTLG